jgi:uncharacterized membrane protein
MKSRVLILALLACAAPGSAQEPAREGEIYAAHGTEPFWGLTFEDGKMVWSGDEERIEMVRPAPRPRGNVHVYRTPRMTVEISHEGRCNDGMSDYEYPDTVRIRFGRGARGRALEGCGGGVLPPVTLAETSWQIVDIDGTHVGGELYKLGFEDDGRMRGQAGCNGFSAVYTQSGRSLTPGAVEATRMSCSDEHRSNETRMMQLLSGPIEIGWRGGMIMVLRGSNLHVTLRRL